MAINNILLTVGRHHSAVRKAGAGFRLFAPVLLSIGTLGGCAEVDERIDDELARQNEEQACELLLVGNTANDLYAGAPGSPATRGSGWTLQDQQPQLTLQLRGSCRADISRIEINAMGGPEGLEDTDDYDPDITLTCGEDVGVESCSLSTEDGGPSEIGISVNDPYDSRFSYMLSIVSASEYLPEVSDDVGDPDGGPEILACPDVTLPTFRDIDTVEDLSSGADWRTGVRAWLQAVPRWSEEGSTEDPDIEAEVAQFCAGGHPYDDIWDLVHSDHTISGARSGWRWHEWNKNLHGVVHDGSGTPVGVVISNAAFRSGDVDWNKIGHTVAECLDNQQGTRLPLCVSVPSNAEGCGGSSGTRCVLFGADSMDAFATNCGKRTYDLSYIEGLAADPNSGVIEREGAWFLEDDVRVFTSDACNEV